jgi:hypothetical protein
MRNSLILPVNAPALRDFPLLKETSMKLMPTSYGRRVPLAYILGHTNDNRPELPFDKPFFERFFRSYMLKLEPKVLLVTAEKRLLLTYIP